MTGKGNNIDTRMSHNSESQNHKEICYAKGGGAVYSSLLMKKRGPEHCPLKIWEKSGCFLHPDNKSVCIVMELYENNK
jgi:hypothetical protein